MIKMIAIDLDGTLLTSEKTISHRTIETLKKAKAQGVKVVLCTGRPLLSVIAHLDTLGLRDEGDYAVTFNGGLVQKNDTGEILSKDVMTLADIEEIYTLTNKLFLPLDLVSEDTVFRLSPQPKEYPSLYHTINHILIFKDCKLEDVPKGRDYNKLVTSVETPYLEEQLAKIPKEYFEKYNIVRSGPKLFEFQNKHVSKANGLAKLGSLLGIKQEEIMALGDEENDFSMIEYAGLGVVMENGSQVVKDIAQHITDTNDNDGVAKAVEKFVLTKK